MPAFRVVVCPSDFDELDAERRVLEPAGARVVKSYAQSTETLLSEVADADALLVQYTPIDEEVLTRARKCKVVVRYGTGYDNLDLDAATRLGVYAAYVPDYCKAEVATHALALLLSLARRVPKFNEATKRGLWNPHAQRPIFDVTQQTVGIVGFGRIGRAFAHLARPLFGKVLACDPYINPSVFEEYGVCEADLDRALRDSDVVSLHVLLTREPTDQYDQPTYHLIGGKQLAMMKPTAYLVNTARGPVVDDQALCKALSEGTIAGAGLDVVEDEPVSEHASERLARYSELLASGKLVVTHHVAYLSEESVVRVRRMAAEEVVRVLQGGEPRGLLNPEVRGKARAALS